MHCQKSVLIKNVIRDPVPLNLRLRLYPRSVTVGKMAGIFTKHIWQPYVRLIRRKPIVPDFWGSQHFRNKGHFQHLCKQLYLFFALVQGTCFYSAANKRHLREIVREVLKWMMMSILFSLRWELVIVMACMFFGVYVWNKMPESIF